MEFDFPPECPLFEITYAEGQYVPAGAIVEGVEICQNGVGQRQPGRIGARILDESKVYFLPFRDPVQGYAGVMCLVDHVKALTPAAEEMLAIARGDK